jgi:hypothetical protein
MSTVVMALYINSEHVSGLYSRPEILWIVLPLLLIWISNMWIAAGRCRCRGEVLSDPVTYAVRS